MIVTTGMVQGPDATVVLLIHGGSNCRNVWMPLYSPCAVGASIVALLAVVVS